MPFRTVLPQTETGLVLYLTGNAGAGKIMHDCSPMGNNGRIYGATWVEGKFGKALQFDGVDDYVRISNANGFNESITVLLWVNHKDLSGEQHYIRGWTSTGFLTWKNPYNALVFIVVDSGGTWHTTKTATNVINEADAWYHIAFVYDKDTQNTAIYLNGEELPLAEQDVPTSRKVDTSLHIGSYTTSSYFFNGTIDEVRIYNRALSAEEIRAHFKGAVIKLRP